MNELISIVIVRATYSLGYTATIRFTDSRLDEIISSASHWMIYERIENIVRHKTGELYG